MALSAWEARVCPSCRTYDSMVPLGPAEPQTTRTPDGRRFVINLYRCVVCGLQDGVKRRHRDSRKDEQPNDSGALSTDGLHFIAGPNEEAEHG